MLPFLNPEEMYKDMEFIVIGILDDPHIWLPPEVMEIIRNAKYFSGGTRHRKHVVPLLPSEHVWVDITGDIEGVFKKYCSINSERWVCFASGDPLFFGFANTILRLIPEAKVSVYPAFNSLQVLAHRMLLPYHDMHIVSQTGRPWKLLDDALIKSYALIGVLTDRKKSPQQIASRMLKYGYRNYEACVGECLGNPQHEHISPWMSVENLSCFNETFTQPNCMILRQTHRHTHTFGIPEDSFCLLDGRANMITKAPIRLVTLSALHFHDKSCFWDIGFCTGSVSIEARLQFPHLQIEAFEVRPQCEQIIQQNSQQFGAPGINVHMCDFMQANLDNLPRPDAVFIGGHGGQIMQMVQRICQYLLPGGIIAFNSVSRDSQDAFLCSISQCGLTLLSQHRITLDEHNPITIMSAIL